MRTVFVAVEYLVFFSGFIVVIAMACKLIKHYPPDIVVGVPRVVDLHSFVSARRGLKPSQSIVFYVVDTLQKQKRNDTH